MEKMNKACYLCNKKELKIVKDKLRYDIKRNVLKCKNCGIVYLEPKPITKDYYEETYRKLYTPVLGKKLSAKEIFNIFLPHQKTRINEIKHILNPKMRVLDVGCSTGHFLYSLKDYVKECVGIEFNKEESEFMRNELGIKVYTKSIEETDIPEEYFDLITMFQVLEHIDDPVTLLNNLYKYLKPGGFLVVEVPNLRDALISLYKIEEYSDFWFREPHIFYYCPETLSMVLEKTGFIGNTKTIQSFNLINHINWILNKKPQKTNVEMLKPILVKSNSVDPEIKKEFNQWFQKKDEEYKKLLNKHNLGESILFIGKKEN